jgi:hypothetical protein
MERREGRQHLLRSVRLCRLLLFSTSIKWVCLDVKNPIGYIYWPDNQFSVKYHQALIVPSAAGQLAGNNGAGRPTVSPQYCLRLGRTTGTDRAFV